MATIPAPSSGAPAAAKPSLLKRLLMVLGVLLGLAAAFAAVTVPIVLLALRDHNAQKPLRDALGDDLRAIRDVSPMLAKGAAANPLTVRPKALVLRAYDKDPLNKAAAPTQWDMRVELQELTWRLPKESQVTAEDIQKRQPITVFIFQEWSAPIGTYGKGGPTAFETWQKVWVIPWPDIAPAHLEEFHLLPPGAVRSTPLSGADENAASTQTPTDERGDGRGWILKQVEAAKR